MSLQKKISWDIKKGAPLKVALFGGAFDPITSGHLKVMHILLNRGFQIWLCPCFEHNYGKNMTEPFHRWLMCKKVTRNIKNVFVCDLEIKNKISGGTYNFLKCLFSFKGIERYDFYYVIGLDNALTFSAWYKAEELKKMLKFITLNRPGFNVEPRQWYTQFPHIFIDDKDLVRVSSTQIRELFLTKERNEFDKFKGLLSRIAYNYIKENNLYKD